MIKTHYKETTDGLIVTRTQDVEPFLDLAKAKRENTQRGDIYEVAEFPAVIVETYINNNKITFEEFMQNPEHMMRMARDPDLRAFRTWEGRI